MYTEEHFFAETIAPIRVSYLQDFCAEADVCLRYNAFSKESFLQIFAAVQTRAKKLNIPLQILHNPLDNTVCGWNLPDRKACAVRTAVFDFADRNYFTATSNAHITKMQSLLTSAQHIFTLAHEIHDRQEEIYVSRMNFDFANVLCEAMCNRLLQMNGNAEKTTSGKKINRFFGAPTVIGNVCYIPELTEKISKRYFIKGRPGTGKSTFLKKLAEEAVQKGYDVYAYHCSFDPNSLDMIVVPQLSFCLFDSTAPHEYFPIRPNDEILDLYQECVVPGTDEKFHKEIAGFEADYKAKVADGVTYLKGMKQVVDTVEAQIPNLDENALEAEKNRVLKLMFNL